jgi:hypothetical protein
MPALSSSTRFVNAKISFQDVNPSYIGTCLRSDGTQQLTCHGHPLYRSTDDFIPGQAIRFGFDDSWYTIGSDDRIPGSR